MEMLNLIGSRRRVAFVSTLSFVPCHTCWGSCTLINMQGIRVVCQELVNCDSHQRNHADIWHGLHIVRKAVVVIVGALASMQLLPGSTIRAIANRMPMEYIHG